MTHLTILTPTWNRRQTLARLYESLVSQDLPSGCFEWLVVDDGSTDGTAGYIEMLSRSAPFPIRVIVQDNGGKHRALNRGAREVSSAWMLVLDSDDWMLPSGVRDALDQIKTFDDQAETLAIVSPRVFANRPPPSYPEQTGPMDYATWRAKYFKSDFSMLARTTVIRNHPFPEFDGERFIAESAVYARAFAHGGLRLSSAGIMGAEYQRDGLSSKSLNNRITSPLGAMYTYRCQLDAGMGGILRARSWLNYHRFFWHARASGAISRSERPFGGRFWRPAGWVLYSVDRFVLRGQRR